MVSYMIYSDLPGVYIMGYILYVGFATHRRATVRTRLCLTKKKRKTDRHSIYVYCKHIVTHKEDHI
jgi:hypothetical protein